MALSVKERILQDVETALKVISVANGYKRDVDLVERFKLREMDQSPQTVMQVKQGSDVRRGTSLGVEDHVLTVLVVTKFRHDPSYDELSTDAVANDHEEDVYRAVMADPQRNGLASRTQWGATETVESDEDGNKAILSMAFDIDYGHGLGDPAAARIS